MTKYRRKKGSKVWHWCTNCSEWPTSDYDERTDRPDWDLHNECKSKEKENNCKTEQ